jgi:hypothetical protein
MYAFNYTLKKFSIYKFTYKIIFSNGYDNLKNYINSIEF